MSRPGRPTGAKLAKANAAGAEKLGAFAPTLSSAHAPVLWNKERTRLKPNNRFFFLSIAIYPIKTNEKKAYITKSTKLYVE